MVMSDVVSLGDRPRVLVVHQQTVFAEALAFRLAMENQLEVEEAVSRGSRALALVPSRRVGVVLVGQWLEDIDGIELAWRLRALPAPPRVLLLGETENCDHVTDALGAGVAAWVGRESPIDLLVQVIEAVRRGETWLPPTLLGPVIDRLLSRDQPPAFGALHGLTARELEVLECMVEGLGQNAIAERLYLSPNTVRTHRRRTLAKLGVHSSLEAVAAARRAGIAVVGGEGDIAQHNGQIDLTWSGKRSVS
jgi:DNA-binding NarL/FixJ family response regulator